MQLFVIRFRPYVTLFPRGMYKIIVPHNSPDIGFLLRSDFVPRGLFRLSF